MDEETEARELRDWPVATGFKVGEPDFEPGGSDSSLMLGRLEGCVHRQLGAPCRRLFPCTRITRSVPGGHGLLIE